MIDEPSLLAGFALEDEPPVRCARHTDEAWPWPCGPCGDAREANTTWHTARRLAVAQAVRERARDATARLRAAIEACGACDEFGYVGPLVCRHDPDAGPRATRRAAELRALIPAASSEEES